ncbi:hypothetical protein PQR08_32325 [Caballeronia jiangsuensis]|uniref:Fis family transcriptional regulator n=1 Tax=Caballeronia jiangsuensis TaxID=1458357 RepID=A0ABW9CX30_9BURK
MVSKSRDRKNPRHGPALSKQMLLPLPLPLVNELSLVSHLALASFQSGSQHLLYQLIRTTYLSYLMWNEGLGAGTYQLYCDAEREIEAIAAVRANSGPWTLSENASSVLEKIVCIYDVQLGNIPGGLFTRCHAKLEQLLAMLVVRSGEALLRGDHIGSADKITGY